MGPFFGSRLCSPDLFAQRKRPYRFSWPPQKSRLVGGDGYLFESSRSTSVYGVGSASNQGGGFDNLVNGMGGAFRWGRVAD
jgi:hypothetical protein